jgi:hypothetical protein
MGGLGKARKFASQALNSQFAIPKLHFAMILAGRKSRRPLDCKLQSSKCKSQIGLTVLPDYDKFMSDNQLPAAASDPKWAATWLELGQGAPTLAGLARVASIAVATGGDKSIKLSREARGLLHAARNRGVMEIKGSNRAFDAPGRMLAVYVEVDAERTLIFRSRENPAYTIRFLAGFRELCAAGLVMHHINTEFSLTREGLELAQTVPADEVRDVLAPATEFGVLE